MLTRFIPCLLGNRWWTIMMVRSDAICSDVIPRHFVAFRDSTNPYTWLRFKLSHYSVVIMGTMASQITSLTIVYSTVYSGADQRKHQSSASLAFVRGIHRWPLNSPHNGPVTRKMFPFDDVIIAWLPEPTWTCVWRRRLFAPPSRWLRRHSNERNQFHNSR